MIIRIRHQIAEEEKKQKKVQQRVYDLERQVFLLRQRTKLCWCVNQITIINLFSFILIFFSYYEFQFTIFKKKTSMQLDNVSKTVFYRSALLKRILDFERD